METRKPFTYLYKIVDNLMVVAPIRFLVKFSIRPYMTNMSKPTIEIKHVARILKHGHAT